jgi:hypothetical protein
MGTECSIEKQIDYTEIENDRLFAYSLQDTLNISDVLTFRNYKEYENKIKLFKNKVKESIKKVVVITEYKPKIYKLITKLRNSNIKLQALQPLDRLYDTMLQVYHKINSIYTNSLLFPKDELGKVTYDLLARYLTYKDHLEMEYDEETSIVVNKIIKRVNFFSEDFPFKLNKIEQIAKTKRIFVFGYDSFSRLNFYLKPNFIESMPNNSDTGRSTKSLIRLTSNNSDYLLYIFFIIELFTPILKENLNFSEEVNIFIDFNHQSIDSELVIMILHYFSTMYPLILNKVCLTNYIIEDKNVHSAFIAQIQKEDCFNSVVFCEEIFKLKILNFSSSNCVPIEYGGYHYLDLSIVNSIQLIDELIEYILSLILIKDS